MRMLLPEVGLKAVAKRGQVAHAAVPAQDLVVRAATVVVDL